MKPLDQLTSRGQLRRLRKLAHDALPHWGLEGGDVHFLDHGENTTYRITLGPDRFMMRLARPGYHSDRGLLSEVEWLRSLSDAGFGVPDPVAHDHGYLLRLERPGVPERRILVFRWVTGRFAKKRSRRSVTLTARLLAQLHEHAQTFEPSKNFERGDWNADTLLTEAHGKFLSWRHAQIPDGLHGLYEEVNAALLERLRERERGGPRWLLHADLHRGNVLFEGDHAHAIDFDDCGFGHPAVDVAIVLGATWAKDYEDAWSNFCRGYLDVAGALPFTKPMVREQFLTRAVQMVGWLADRGRDIPEFKKIATERAQAYEPYLRAWLSEQR